MKKPFWPKYKFNNKNLGLERIKTFLERLDNPQNNLPPIIHIAGTNGKGSTTAFLKFILEAEGYKVHRYTSPHLVDFNERIEVASKIISDKYLNELTKECKTLSEKYNLEISFFETITTMAFLAFSRNKADATILEVGLGGRLDATNIIENPLSTIITSISFDHMRCLGNSLKKIAIEKAGIMKKDCPVIINKQKSSVSEILNKIAKEKKCPVYEYGKHWFVKISKDGFTFEGFGKILNLPKPNLLGEHQIINAGGVIASLLSQKKLKVSEKAIQQGLLNAKWKGRLQNLTNTKLGKLLPRDYSLWLDGAHNEDGARTLMRWLKKSNKPTFIILGILKRKDPLRFIRQLKDNAIIIIGTKIEDESECMNKEEFLHYTKILNIKSVFKKDFVEALKFIKNNFGEKYPEAQVIICGSLYLAGTVLKRI